MVAAGAARGGYPAAAAQAPVIRGLPQVLLVAELSAAALPPGR